MRRMYVGGLILLVFLAASLYNVYYLDGKIEELTGFVDEAERQVLAENFSGAEQTIQKAIDTWNSMEGYTHIFIRHSEIDGAMDAFYEFLSDICAQEEGAAYGSGQKLRAHLQSIAGMEHVTIGSIF